MGNIVDDAVRAVQKIQVIGDYAFLATFGSGSSGSGLAVINISDPTNPSIAAFLSATELLGVRDMAIRENYAYLTGDTKGLVVVDISNPLSPHVVSSAVYSGQVCPNGISVHGAYAFIVDRCSNGLTVFDITDPATPNEGLSIRNDTDFNQLSAIFVDNNYAYISGSEMGKIAVIDISDPTDPAVFRTVGYVGVGDVQSPNSMQIVGDHLYIADSKTHALLIEKIDSPTSTTPISRLSNINALQLHIVGGQAYVATFPASPPNYPPFGVLVVDISTPSNPTLIKNIATATCTTSGSSMSCSGLIPFRIFAHNSYVYITGGRDFAIIDPDK